MKESFNSFIRKSMLWLGFLCLVSFKSDSKVIEIDAVVIGIGREKGE